MTAILENLELFTQICLNISLILTQVDKMEFSCLKALLLFNDDNTGLKNMKQVEQVTAVKA